MPSRAISPRCEIIGQFTRRNQTMKTEIWLSVGAGALLSLSALAQTAPEVTLTRIECGTAAKTTNVAERFSDTFAYSKDVALSFTFSCYLIKHGDEYMVWDTGFAPGSNPNAPKVGIVERLAEVKVKPEQVKYVGISHFHGDHTGQLAPFAGATLLIGKGDWDREQTVESLELSKKLAANLKATVIIQHDLRDVGKLPAFPAAAR